MAFFPETDNIERYLQHRMNEFFAPFSSDFRLSILPTGPGNGQSKITSGGDSSSSALTTAGGPSASIFSRAAWNAKLDLVEGRNDIDVSMELPGVRKEDLQVHVDQEGRLLTIQAERREQSKKEGDGSSDSKYHYSERTYGLIKRTVVLPPSADVDKVKSSFADGVLHLHFPKKAPSETMKQITIA